MGADYLFNFIDKYKMQVGFLGVGACGQFVEQLVGFLCQKPNAPE
ncbi:MULTISPECIES: hypothetical protein [unclassified Helicobacter]|nr:MULTISPECIES: hypothetical protein [unclassified Helicobacter]